ncbi:MAG: FAD-dependent oxidoreductase [Bacteroidota bacterium]
MTKNLQVLGGGPAGLAIAYFAKQKALDLTLFEAEREAGGNCRTITELINGDYFRYDTGAHRLHDKDEASTDLVKSLLGDDLLSVEAPSQIIYKTKKIDFPLSPFDLLNKLGPVTFMKAASEILAQRAKTGKVNQSANFEEKVYRDYGRILADAFLTNYSEKLWGKPCDQLSTTISGGRLKGLNLKTFIIEQFQGKKAKTKHLDGSFYYPRLGYGMIVSALAEALSKEELKTSSPVTRLEHEGDLITKIHTTGGRSMNAGQIASTLPLNLMLRLLHPKPPSEIADIANSMAFRDVFLVILILDKQRINTNATQYFPESKYAFTRIYEPKNRSMEMAPKDKTSLVIEVPMVAGSNLPGKQFIDQQVIKPLVKLKMFKTDQVITTRTHLLKHAYPVLEVGVEEKVEHLTNYLSGFTNLHLAGRNGLFRYNHLHDQLMIGRALVDRLAER